MNNGATRIYWTRQRRSITNIILIVCVLSVLIGSCSALFLLPSYNANKRYQQQLELCQKAYPEWSVDRCAFEISIRYRY